MRTGELHLFLGRDQLHFTDLGEVLVQRRGIAVGDLLGDLELSHACHVSACVRVWRRDVSTPAVGLRLRTGVIFQAPAGGCAARAAGCGCGRKTTGPPRERAALAHGLFKQRSIADGPVAARTGTDGRGGGAHRAAFAFQYGFALHVAFRLRQQHRGSVSALPVRGSLPTTWKSIISPSFSTSSTRSMRASRARSRAAVRRFRGRSPRRRRRA
jgi:hypothetical protein